MNGKEAANSATKFPWLVVSAVAAIAGAIAYVRYGFSFMLAFMVSVAMLAAAVAVARDLFHFFRSSQEGHLPPSSVGTSVGALNDGTSRNDGSTLDDRDS